MSKITKLSSKSNTQFRTPTRDCSHEAASQHYVNMIKGKSLTSGEGRFAWVPVARIRAVSVAFNMCNKCCGLSFCYQNERQSYFFLSRVNRNADLLRFNICWEAAVADNHHSWD